MRTERDLLLQLFFDVVFVVTTTPQRLASHALLLARAALVALVAGLRFCTFKTHMQAYLDIAQERLANLDQSSSTTTSTTTTTKPQTKQQKKSKTKLSPTPPQDMISAGVVQRLVSNIWDYAGVASLQLLVPPVLLLFASTLMVIRSSLGAEQATLSSWSDLGNIIVWWVALSTTLLNFFGYAMLRVSGSVPTIA
eukprot:m.156153 g.156153  ORF g.156153 m.156153 type:complete len:195 (+) comp16290_c0_seq5:1173-1757(+)